jgi:hypothetical protein
MGEKFFRILKVIRERSQIRSWIRSRIRIRTKISQIPNTGIYAANLDIIASIRPGVDSCSGTPLEISLLSGIEVGLHYCAMCYETYCIEKGESGMKPTNIKKLPFYGSNVLYVNHSGD